MTDETKPNDNEERSDIQGLLEFYRLIYPEHTIEEIANALQLQKEELGDDAFSKKLMEYGSYPELLMRSIDAHTDQSFFMNDAIKGLTDKDKIGDAWEYVPGEDADPSDKAFTIKNRTSSLNQSLKGAEVKGREARLLILSANRNIRKVYLYNSGFNVIIQAPSMIEINLIYNRLSEAMGEYGRMLGAVFFMYSDFKIKSMIWDFIESLVIDSNLNKYDEGQRLRDNVSLQDYGTILLSFGALMYKSGYPFSHVCTNSECKHTEEATVDLNLLQLNDYDKIPHEQLSFLAAGTKVTPEDLRKYRKGLGFQDHVDIGNYRIHRKVPSMSDYISAGEQFNDELVMSITSLKDEKKVNQYLQFNYARMFEPWVRYVEVLNDDGSVSFKVADRESLTLVMSQIQSGPERDKFAEEMLEYTKRTMITYTGYPVHPCPKCQKLPAHNEHGFTSFDVQTAFFTMAIRMLIERP